MDSFTTWRDMRDPGNPGVSYNASGCLVHGLSVVADSIHSVSRMLVSGLFKPLELRIAINVNFIGHEKLRLFCACQDKFGNGVEETDMLTARIAAKVAKKVGALRNPAGSAFLPDFSTPSTHLLYGRWVGATPDGRGARSMLGYGTDPLPCGIKSDLPARIISAWKLPYLQMKGGYASHIGLRPTDAPPESSMEDKALWMRDSVLCPLFKLGDGAEETPFYVYFNVDDAGHLRELLKDPAKYAPTGVYIMRIHGTFVNFLDLSPAIQEDIITRLNG
jgi:formate C-acetyltransferase